MPIRHHNPAWKTKNDCERNASEKKEKHLCLPNASQNPYNSNCTNKQSPHKYLYHASTDRVDPSFFFSSTLSGTKHRQTMTQTHTRQPKLNQKEKDI
jgi:hypothetical protein